MNVLVIGLGSMGKRRIRLLKQFDQVDNIIGIDARKDRREYTEKNLKCKTYGNIDEALMAEKRLTSAFISTSPLAHAELIHICLKNNLHVFTELNLVDTLYDDNIKLAKSKNRVLFLSSTFLYRKEIEYIHKKIQNSKCKVNYMYHAGQYLPDWHPWENYKDFFVGQKKTNGCREFMAIEMPWLSYVFGGIRSVQAVGDKISSLEVEYPDNYILLLEHENGNKGAVSIDIISRKASRKLEVFGESIHLEWKGTPDGLYWYDYERKRDVQVQLYESIDRQNEYSAFIIENAYYSEISNFLGVLEGKEKARYSFEQDKKILRLIDYIEANGGIGNETI